ncbi:MAG TPA: TorF family putative porin, partial [Caulobacteraceae bacterium]|nr:TorF family putative porin [Caulobacteraceae bacterium]
MAGSALALLFCIALLTLSGAARAQVGLSASFDTDYRFRGFSLSNDRPTLSLAFSFDHASGAYAGASAIATETPQTRIGFLGYVADLGYARRIDGATSWDVGATYTSVNTNTQPNYT